MNDTYKKVLDDKYSALEQLSEEAIWAALENEEPVIEEALHEKIIYLTGKATEALQKGEDYLSVLKPDEQTSSLDRVAHLIVQEAFDEEFEDMDDE